MAKELEGKVVLVTGGASGLGKAIATACHSAGAKVVLGDLNEKALHEAEDALEKLWSVGPLDKASTTVLDVSNEISCANSIEYVIHRFGRLDVLINCAGIMDGFHPADSLDLAVWERVLAVNLTGPMLMTKHAVKHFLSREQPSGAIVNIGSVASRRGAFAGAAYTAAKHGLVGLTRNTAAAYKKHGIRCNALLPGGMETNIGSSIPRDFNQERMGVCQQFIKLSPGTQNVDKVAKTVVHLASDAAEPINGATIEADGGLAAF